MNTTNIVIITAAIVIGLPLTVYLTVKLATWAKLTGRYRFEEWKREQKRKNGEVQPPKNNRIT